MIKEAIIQTLDWDTQYFGIKCGKIVIPSEGASLINYAKTVAQYDFISIQNCGNNILTNKEIADKTNAYLVDINVQFEKSLKEKKADEPNFFEIERGMNLEPETIEKLTVEEMDFQFSKFVCDDELKRRNGYLVYKEWLRNARKQENKLYVLLKENGRVCAYTLFSLDDNSKSGKIELIKVDSDHQGQRIGSKMIDTIENYLIDNNYNTLIVGTQVNNIPAINLYHKMGFRETSRTSVFHDWIK